MLFIWFMLAGFIFLLTPHRLTKTFQDAFNSIFGWPLSIGRGFMLSARTEQPVARDNRKYNELRNHLANIMAQRDQAYEEITKLSGLRKRLPLEGAKLVRAGVIRDSVNSRSEFIIDCGQKDGLAAGQFVLADNSIIGALCDISSWTARVKLFTDPTSSIAVNIAGLKTVMKGNGDNSARVEMSKREIEVGENVLALRKPGFLGEPMIIGQVAKCERNDKSALLWDITIRPVCDIESIDDVTVIVMNPRE
jgi:cell shape-determining protein MreC